MPPKRNAAEAELQDHASDAIGDFELEDCVYKLDDVRTLALNLTPTHVDFSAGKGRGSGRWVISALNIRALACVDDTDTSHMAYVCALEVLRKDHGLPKPPGLPVQSVLLAMRKRLDERTQQRDGALRCTHCVAPLRRRRRPPKHGWMGCFSIGGQRCASCAANRRYHCFFPDPEVEVTREVNVRPAFEEDVFSKEERTTPEPAPEPVAMWEHVPFDYATARRAKVEAEVATALAAELANAMAKRQKTASQDAQPKMTPTTASPRASASGIEQAQVARMIAQQSQPRPGARTRSQTAAALHSPQAEPRTRTEPQPPQPSSETQQAAPHPPQPRSQLHLSSADPVEPSEMDLPPSPPSCSTPPSATNDHSTPVPAAVNIVAPTVALPHPSSAGHVEADIAGATAFASTSAATDIMPLSQCPPPMLPTPPRSEQRVADTSTLLQAGPSSRSASRPPNHSTSNQPQPSTSTSHESVSAQTSAPSAPLAPPMVPAVASVPTPPSPASPLAAAAVQGGTTAATLSHAGLVTANAATPSLATVGLVSRLYTSYCVLYPALKTAMKFDNDEDTERFRKLIPCFTRAVEKVVAGGVAEAAKLPIYWDRVERDLEPTLQGNSWLKDRLLADAAQLGAAIHRIVVANGLSEILVE